MDRTALAWMWRPAPAVPEQFNRLEIGPILWQTLLRDGLATHVWGQVAIPADRPETPEIRASAVRALVPARGVVGRGAAVWVHTGGDRPGRIDVLVAPHARRPDPHPRRVPHEAVLPPGDLVGIGPLRVTSVERTAVDVARWSRPPETAALLERLVRCGGLDPGRALIRLEAFTGHRGFAEARAALGALEPVVSPGRSPRRSPVRARRPRATP